MPDRVCVARDAGAGRRSRLRGRIRRVIVGSCERRHAGLSTIRGRRLYVGMENGVAVLNDAGGSRGLRQRSKPARHRAGRSAAHGVCRGRRRQQRHVVRSGRFCGHAQRRDRSRPYRRIGTRSTHVEVVRGGRANALRRGCCFDGKARPYRPFRSCRRTERRWGGAYLRDGSGQGRTRGDRRPPRTASATMSASATAVLVPARWCWTTSTSMRSSPAARVES